MLLTITATHQPAGDLGYLLHKHPDKVQTFKLAFGAAHVFYPEADANRCTAALLLDLDPVALVRGRPGGGKNGGTTEAGPLANYVNDRPYVASSFLAVALGQVFGTALAGRCENRPDLPTLPLPLSATFGPVRVQGGRPMIERLFVPLGYEVEAVETTDSALPQVACWTVTLTATTPLRLLLAHLYVLIPVLDNEKHYWVGEDEIDKLLRHGEGWLPAHPERELITRRYLKHARRLARFALDRLAELDDAPIPDDGNDEPPPDRFALNDQRVEAVLNALRDSGARRVLDLGCGDGKLLRALLKDSRFEAVMGVDVSTRELERAAERLDLDRLPDRQRERLTLLQSALTYRDRRLAGYDAAAVVEVIEHLEPDRLPAFTQAVFGCARPGTVVVTTPNRDYNRHYENLAEGRLRHRDHRFEWNPAEFRAWAEATAARHAYTVVLSGVGEADPQLGQPTQMAVFTCA